MDYKEKATILRVCSNRKGERCSHCPAFGQGWNCMKNAMKDGANAITDLLARAEAAEAEKQKLCEEADHLKDLLKEAEARADAMEKERDIYKAALKGEQA